MSTSLAFLRFVARSSLNAFQRRCGRRRRRGASRPGTRRLAVVGTGTIRSMAARRSSVPGSAAGRRRSHAWQARRFAAGKAVDLPPARPSPAGGFPRGLSPEPSVHTERLAGQRRGPGRASAAAGAADVPSGASRAGAGAIDRVDRAWRWLLVPAGRCSLSLMRLRSPRVYYLGVHPVNQGAVPGGDGGQPELVRRDGQGEGPGGGNRHDAIPGGRASRGRTPSPSATSCRSGRRSNEQVAFIACPRRSNGNMPVRRGKRDEGERQQRTRAVEGSANAFGVMASQATCGSGAPGCSRHLPRIGRGSPVKSSSASKGSCGGARGAPSARAAEAPRARPGAPTLRSNGGRLSGISA